MTKEFSHSQSFPRNIYNNQQIKSTKIKTKNLKQDKTRTQSDTTIHHEQLQDG